MPNICQVGVGEFRIPFFFLTLEECRLKPPHLCGTVLNEPINSHTTEKKVLGSSSISPIWLSQKLLLAPLYLPHIAIENLVVFILLTRSHTICWGADELPTDSRHGLPSYCRLASQVGSLECYGSLISRVLTQGPWFWFTLQFDATSKAKEGCTGTTRNNCFFLLSCASKRQPDGAPSAIDCSEHHSHLRFWEVGQALYLLCAPDFMSCLDCDSPGPWESPAFPRCLVRRLDDTYMDLFLVIFQLLKDAGKLMVPGLRSWRDIEYDWFDMFWDTTKLLVLQMRHAPTTATLLFQILPSSVYFAALARRTWTLTWALWRIQLATVLLWRW